MIVSNSGEKMEVTALKLQFPTETTFEKIHAVVDQKMIVCVSV